MISINMGRKEERGRHRPSTLMLFLLGMVLGIYSADTDIPLSREF